MLYTSKLLYINYTSMFQKKEWLKRWKPKQRAESELRGWGQEPKMQSWKPPITAWPWSSNQGSLPGVYLAGFLNCFGQGDK